MIVGAVMLFFGVNYLKGFNPLAQQDHFFAVYDKIEGLAVSNPVLVNGFKVGQVTRVEFHDSGDGKILVEFTVDQSDLNIPINSVAQIFSSDLFGSKAIELLRGDSTLFAVNGDTLIASSQEDITEAVRKELAPLRAKTDQLIAGVDEIITNMNKVFKYKHKFFDFFCQFGVFFFNSCHYILFCIFIHHVQHVCNWRYTSKLICIY